MSSDTTASLTGSVRRTSAPARARLVAVHPPEVRGELDFDGERVVVGRAEGVALRVEHGTVSRQHLAVRWDAELQAHVAEDLDSRNGAALDGAPLTSARPLDDGAVLGLGAVLLVYERLGAGEEGATVSREALPGRAVAMARLRAQLERAAPDRAPLLLVGETGSGKESIAREAHRLSGRRGPFVSFNCATLSATIAESQLFGHLRGAFTGATEAQPGLFRAADGGTLFLDEIGEVPGELQAKLLRALQENEVHPVGSVKPLRVDVRVVAASNRDLAAAAQAGAFRLDLYARLSLWEAQVPPLRRRRVDLFAWIDRLRRRFGDERQVALPSLRFRPDAAETLLLADWTLNLRAIDRLVRELVPPPDHAIAADDLPAWVTARAAIETAAATAPRKEPLPTREEFSAAFAELDGNVRALARRFARDRRQIYRWIGAYGLDRGDAGDAD